MITPEYPGEGKESLASGNEAWGELVGEVDDAVEFYFVEGAAGEIEDEIWACEDQADVGW